MPYSKIQTLGQLRSHLIANTAPDADLAHRAGQLAIDATQHVILSRITAGRELPGALLWQRIADHLSAAPQAAALTFAAVCAFNAGHMHRAAAIIARHDALIDTGERSALIEILRLDHRIADQQARTAAHS